MDIPSAPLLALTLPMAAWMTGCSTRPPMQTVSRVDLDRFMGDWYVISHIPTWIERDAYDAVESYELGAGGRIETTFTFHKGGFDGPRKVYTPVGFVTDDPSNAEWRMQFVWPLKSEYLIIQLADDYSTTVIGRTKRDYAWIMSRTPGLDADRYDELENLLAERGYDTGKIRRVPQSGAP